MLLPASMCWQRFLLMMMAFMASSVSLRTISSRGVYPHHMFGQAVLEGLAKLRRPGGEPGFCSGSHLHLAGDAR